MKKSDTKQLVVKGLPITTRQAKAGDFISLTDIARYKNQAEPKDVVKNWLRNRGTIEFLGLWERVNNPDFKGVEFDAFLFESGSNSFVLSPEKWIKSTNAVGILTKRGKGGGTYAHQDIAFEFATWISSEFKLYLIKEFQRLKEEEVERKQLGWDLKRNLAAINYRIHTDAVKEHLIPPKVSQKQAVTTYASEADVLNKALFGKTAGEWRQANSKKSGNIRDYATAAQLVCLSNLESLNAEFIKQGLPQGERLMFLNQTAIDQMKSLLRITKRQLLK